MARSGRATPLLGESGSGEGGPSPSQAPSKDASREQGGCRVGRFQARSTRSLTIVRGLTQPPGISSHPAAMTNRRSNAVQFARPGSRMAAVVLTIAVMATACGGGGDDEASPGPNATSAPASDGGADKARGEGGAYCDVLNEQAALLTAFLSRSPAADPATQQQIHRDPEGAQQQGAEGRPHRNSQRRRDPGPRQQRSCGRADQWRSSRHDGRHRTTKDLGVPGRRLHASTPTTRTSAGSTRPPLACHEGRGRVPRPGQRLHPGTVMPAGLASVLHRYQLHTGWFSTAAVVGRMGIRHISGPRAVCE